MDFHRAKEEMTKIFLRNKEKITLKEFAFIPNKCHIILQDFLGINNFVLSRISKGEITNQEIPVVFFPSFFWNSPIYRQEVNFWWNFCQCAELDHPFWIFSLSRPFHKNFFPVSIPKIYRVMHELYISWLCSYRQQMSNAMKANIKFIVTWLYVAKKIKRLDH